MSSSRRRAPDTPTVTSNTASFKASKRPCTRSPTALGRMVRIVGILTILSAGFDLFLFFMHTNRLAVPSWVFIICSIITFMFCIVGYFGTTLYDGTLMTCFILFLALKTLLSVWEVGLVFIYNMALVAKVLSVLGVVASLIVVATSVWFAVVLHAYGPPPAEDMAFSAFVI